MQSPNIDTAAPPITTQVGVGGPISIGDCANAASPSVDSLVGELERRRRRLGMVFY
jgi:hypothetical protein